MRHKRLDADDAYDDDDDDVQMIWTYLRISLSTLLLCCHCCEWIVQCGVYLRGMTMENLNRLTPVDLVCFALSHHVWCSLDHQLSFYCHVAMSSCVISLYVRSVSFVAVVHTEVSVSSAAQLGHCCSSFLCCCSKTLELSSSELSNCCIC